MLQVMDMNKLRNRIFSFSAVEPAWDASKSCASRIRLGDFATHFPFSSIWLAVSQKWRRFAANIFTDEVVIIPSSMWLLDSNSECEWQASLPSTFFCTLSLVVNNIQAGFEWRIIAQTATHLNHSEEKCDNLKFVWSGYRPYKVGNRVSYFSSQWIIHHVLFLAKDQTFTHTMPVSYVWGVEIWSADSSHFIAFSFSPFATLKMIHSAG